MPTLTFTLTLAFTNTHDPRYDSASQTWSREFASGTKATFTPHINEHGVDMGGTGTVVWGTKPF